MCTGKKKNSNQRGFYVASLNRSYSSMAPRLSGQTSIFGVVFFVCKSLWELRDKRNLKLYF